MVHHVLENDAKVLEDILTAVFPREMPENVDCFSRIVHLLLRMTLCHSLKTFY